MPGNLLNAPRIWLKVNIIALLEFEHAYYDVAAQYINHNATRTSMLLMTIDIETAWCLFNSIFLQ